MRVAAVLSLLYFCACCALVTIIISFGLPQSHIIQGPKIFYVPLIVGVVVLLAAVLSIFWGKRVNPPPMKNPTPLRWVLLVVGTIVLFCGYVIMNMSIFVPHIFGSENALPQIGVFSWIVMSLILVIILSLISRMNSIKRPNLFRYFALIIVFISASLTLIQSLILIYAVPGQPPHSFPFLSGLMTIAFIPFALLVSGISRDNVSTRTG
jgi:hypothetical protein